MARQAESTDEGDVVRIEQKVFWMPSIEQKILACSAELNPDPHQRQKMRNLMAPGIDGDQLIHMAVKEGLAGLLYRNFQKSGGLETLSQEQIERLEALYYQTVVLNLNLMKHLKEVLHLLGQKQIQVVLLQGISLLQEIYEDIGLRPLIDIDLWVLHRDYPGLISILNSLEYQRDVIYPNTFRRGSTTFDLHTHILWADRIKARKLLLTKNQWDIYSNTRIIQFEGQEVRCLNQYDQALYLSLHTLKHKVNRMIWLVDIRSLLATWERADWEELINRARELDQEKIVSYMFFLLVQLFDFQAPLEARQLLENQRLHFLEKRILRERIKNDSLPMWGPTILFCARRGFRKRFTFVLESLFPRLEILRQIFFASPDHKALLLYWMRILQLFGMLKASLKGKKGGGSGTNSSLQRSLNGGE
ncbi:MAG: nucleotidyltransferase family protein [Desulfatiglandales bacterium]